MEFLLVIFVLLFLLVFLFGIALGNKSDEQNDSNSHETPSKYDYYDTNSYVTLHKQKYFYLGSSFLKQYYQWAKFGESIKWQECYVAIDPPSLLIYSTTQIGKQPIDLLASIQPGELYGFWQPKPYDGTEAEIRIDVNKSGYLHTLKIRMAELALQNFIDALRTIASDEQILAFQRSRAYVSHELDYVQEVQQQLTGEWTVIAENKLYFTPSYLLILNQHGAIEESIQTDTIHDIEALPRLDDNETGILRFWVGEKRYCFAIPEHELWANDLALAASKTQQRSVEAEILELKKKEADELSADMD